MRPALVANSGSRGKIQLRRRHGCNASALNQRQSVTPLTAATIPRAMTSHRSSGIVKRASGRSQRLGSSHASRFTSTTTSGGKAGCPPASYFLFEAGQALFEETAAPLADDLAGRVQARGDEVVAEPFGRQQHDLRADNVFLSIR